MIAGLFDAYPQASSTKMIAGLFDAYSVLKIGTYKPSSVEIEVAGVYAMVPIKGLLRLEALTLPF